VELNRQAGVEKENFGIGIWLPNCPGWQLIDLACSSQALFSVAIFNNSSADTVKYIINHAELACVVTDTSHLPELLKLKVELPTLKTLICSETAGGIEVNEKLGVGIFSMDEVEHLGDRSGRTQRPPKPSDILAINYTSGTTGDAKGVVLTHGNAVAGASTFRTTVPVQPGDRFLSYLPLAHTYQRMCEQGVLWAGGQIGYASSNPADLVEDLLLLRPTTFSSVPRIFGRFAAALQAMTVNAPGEKGAICREQLNARIQLLNSTQSARFDAFLDPVTQQPVSAVLGLDAATSVITGSAPLDSTVHQFLRAILGTNNTHFLQGFGLTETYSVGLGQLPKDTTAGTCGPPCISMEACLESLPHLSYNITDTPSPRGELLLRGHALFREYFRSEDATRRALTEDGWFRTGDVCALDTERGCFAIIDRASNIVKLSQGEFVSPERLEAMLVSAPSVSALLTQLYIHAESTRSCLVALAGVDAASFAVFASRILGTEIDSKDTEDLRAAAKNKHIITSLIREMDKIIDVNGGKGFERVKNVRIVVGQVFDTTVDGGLVTVT
jgi:long-chain acyl-CoA synthetase